MQKTEFIQSEESSSVEKYQWDQTKINVLKPYFQKIYFIVFRW